jgi:DNA-binding FrmR family transcriptional regulator
LSKENCVPKHCIGCAVEEDCNRTTSREEELMKSLISRLNRIEGQIRGIRKMIARNAYCDDVINQVFAAQAALSAVNKLILEDHLRGCVIRKVQSGEDDVIDELLKTIGKLI